MGVITVDPAELAQAATAFARGSDDAGSVISGLFRSLDTCSTAMAGSDAGGMQWARAYDQAVTDVVTSSTAVVNALGQMSVLLHATGGNHAAADTASVPGGGNAWYPPPPVPLTSFSVCGPPSAAGGSASPPPGWHWVADLMEYTWPNGDQDRLREAGTAWMTASTRLPALISPSITYAWNLVLDQQSPEVPAISSYVGQVGAQVNALEQAYSSLGSACNTYADHLDTAHKAVIGELESFVEWTVGLEVAGGLFSIITLGASEVAANATVIAKAAALAVRVGGLLGDLIENVGQVVQDIIDLAARVIEITTSLKALLALRVAAVTTKAAEAMPGLEAFAALTTRIKTGGGAVVKIVKDSDADADAIVVDSGTTGAWTDAINGPLKPDSTYLVDGKYVYTTDAAGNVAKASAKLNEVVLDKARNAYQQTKVVKAAGGVAGDQGGHIFARVFGGPGEAINLTSQAGAVNQKIMAGLERQWVAAIQDGKTVDVQVTIARDVGSTRPLDYEIKYTIDGVTRNAVIPNE